MIPLCIGGWRLDVVCSPAEVAEAAARRYASFIAAGSPECDIVVDASFTPAEERAGGQHPLLDARLSPAADLCLLDGPGIRGTIAVSHRRASLRLSSPEPSRDLEYFLRIVVAFLALQRGALLIHGAALALDGRCHVFIGRSGSGKSTVVKLSPHAAALGDDLVIVRPGAAGWTVHGTPFWNWQTGDRSAETGQARLAGIYRLVQSREVRLSPLGVGAATAELIANSPIVNGVETLLPDLFAVCRRLALDAPLQSLHFRKDAAFWRLIEPGRAIA